MNIATWKREYHKYHTRPYLIIHHHTSPYVTIHHHTPPYTTIDYHIPSYTIIPHHNSSYLFIPDRRYLECSCRGTGAWHALLQVAIVPIVAINQGLFFLNPHGKGTFRSNIPTRDSCTSFDLPFPSYNNHHTSPYLIISHHISLHHNVF